MQTLCNIWCIDLGEQTKLKDFWKFHKIASNRLKIYFFLIEHVPATFQNFWGMLNFEHPKQSEFGIIRPGIQTWPKLNLDFRFALDWTSNELSLKLIALTKIRLLPLGLKTKECQEVKIKAKPKKCQNYLLLNVDYQVSHHSEARTYGTAFDFKFLRIWIFFIVSSSRSWTGTIKYKRWRATIINQTTPHINTVRKCKE